MMSWFDSNLNQNFKMLQNQMSTSDLIKDVKSKRGKIFLIVRFATFSNSVFR